MDATCPEVLGLLPGLADGHLPAADRARIEGHLPGCPSCTAEAARLRDNALFLAETLGPLRLPPDFSTEFLFTLPRKDAARRAAPATAAAAAPRTMVYGGDAPRRGRALPWIAGAGLVGVAGFLGWLLLGPEEEAKRKEWDRGGAVPAPGDRPAKGTGPADGKAVPAPAGAKPAPPPGPAGGAAAAAAPRNAADVVAAIRAVKGDSFSGPVTRAWDLLAGTPAEARGVLEAAGKEKDGRVRAALVLALAADGTAETREHLRGFLADEAPEVRAAAALGLGRALSFAQPAKKPLPSGPPLAVAVPVGVLEDDPARAELAARLAVEAEPAVRRTLLQVLGPSAGADGNLRERVLEGVKGLYGDELREPALRALQGIQDAALVPLLGEILAQPGTPRGLHGLLLETMVAADAAAAGEALGPLLAQAQDAETRKEIVQAAGKAGGAGAQKALLAGLGDAEAAVRLAAAITLKRFPSREVLDALLKAAEGDADQGVRTEAERAAASMRSGVEKGEGGGGGEAGGDPAPTPPPAGGGN